MPGQKLKQHPLISEECSCANDQKHFSPLHEVLRSKWFVIIIFEFSAAAGAFWPPCSDNASLFFLEPTQEILGSLSTVTFKKILGNT